MVPPVLLLARLLCCSNLKCFTRLCCEHDVSQSDIILAHSLLAMSLEFSQLMWAQLLRTFSELISYVLDFCHLRYRHFGKTQHSMHSFLFKAWTQFGHRQCLCSTCVAITSSVSWWASRLTSDCCVSSKVEIVVLPPLALGQAATVGNVVLP